MPRIGGCSHYSCCPYCSACMRRIYGALNNIHCPFVKQNVWVISVIYFLVFERAICYSHVLLVRLCGVREFNQHACGFFCALPCEVLEGGGNKPFFYRGKYSCIRDV